MSLSCSWKKINLEGLASDLASRSSHSLALFGNRAYVFGGELKPRTPIGNEVIVLELGGGPPRVLAPRQDQPWPSPRVGASMTAHRPSQSFYLWGGRGGKDMAAIGTRSSNEDSADTVDDLWRFDVASEKWERVVTQAHDTQSFPEARSFHTMTAAGNIYVHAGCPAKGRLASLNAYDLDTSKWTTLPPAPEPARGGTVLAPFPTIKENESPLLARWGGFCGHELDGPLDVFDPQSSTWTSHATHIEGLESSSKQPPKRSVHGFVPFHGQVNIGGKKAVALMFMGEGEGAPKELGHDGAGKFLSDIYALLQSDEQRYSWLPLHPHGGDHNDPHVSQPQARGWFAFDAEPLNDGRSGTHIVIHGGLNETNERLDDAWMLEVEAV